MKRFRDAVLSYIQAQWYKPKAAWGILLLVAFIYRIILNIRYWLYHRGVIKAQRLPVPVLVVGNLIVGGTGKTPVVIELVKILQQQGFFPGVISRGYGAAQRSSNVQLLPTPKGAATLNADEPRLIYKKTGVPVGVHSDRILAARQLLAAHPDINILISDDGFQHLRLAADLSLLVFDERFQGNAALLPAGPLREPLQRWHQADAIVVNLMPDSDEAALAKRQAFYNDLPLNLPCFKMQLQIAVAKNIVSGEILDLELPYFKSRRILAAAGIGHPERFFQSLQRLGLNINKLPLPDHFSYKENPFISVQEDIILLTEKDAIKCNHLKDPRIWVVEAQTIIEPSFALWLEDRLKPFSRRLAKEINHGF